MFIQTSFRAETKPAAHALFPHLPGLLARMRPSAVALHAPDSIIYDQGAPAGPLYLVEFGSVRVCRLTADGRRQVSAFHFAGEVFGFESGSEHSCYAESIDHSGIRALRPTSNEVLAENLLPLALESLSRAEHHLLILGRQCAVERMATLILDLAERQDADRLVDLPMQRNDIADYLGLTFETVSRTLRKLKDMKIIRLARINQIDVLDLPALEHLSE